MGDTPVVVGAFVTIIGGFLAVAKIMLNQATKDREADREERLKLAQAIEHMADNSGRVARASERSAKEAQIRNGHLGEQSAKIAEIVTQGNELTAKIVERLEATAKIAAEDRDVLTNQNLHIKTEVHKVIDSDIQSKKDEVQ